eukprot:Lankesteria_metandrocarpae@DN4606_c0_g1_i1.p1
MGNGQGCIPHEGAFAFDNQPMSILDADSMLLLKKRVMASRESTEDRLERYVQSFSLSKDTLLKMTDAFIDELNIGLEQWRIVSAQGRNIDPSLCSFKMLDSYVKDVPTGNETGVFYAIDFGGTNFRAVRLELCGGGKVKQSQYRTSLTAPGISPYAKGLMDKEATATELFDFFARAMKSFMKEQGDLDGTTYGVGFTFSFPCSLRKLNSATLMVWTKMFETGRQTNDPVEGQDVGHLLDKAFERNGVPMQCDAVLNDTVGTLLSCAYEREVGSAPCLVGMIIGTGANACYYDESCPYFGYQGNIINIECGNFNRELPQTNVDMETDFHATANRGAQLFEKMLSGAYLGELCRRTMVKVWQSDIAEAAWSPFSFSTEEAANFVNDRTVDYDYIRKYVEKNWNHTPTDKQCADMKSICQVIYDRSAALSAVAIAACAKKTGRLQPAMGGLTVGIDGSLYKCNKFYRTALSSTLRVILGDDVASLINLSLADDGSGKGACIVASTV